MRTLGAAAVIAAAFVSVACLTGCAGLLGGTANAADLQVGDCLKVGGAPDRPEATKVECGSPESNFKVAATVADSDECPTDADSHYTQRSSFSDAATTVCLDIDWVVGGCMSVDPANDPYRVDCNDAAAPHRQRATQILSDAVGADQCVSGVGYPYDERQFTVCVEDVA